MKMFNATCFSAVDNVFFDLSKQNSIFNHRPQNVPMPPWVSLDLNTFTTKFRRVKPFGNAPNAKKYNFRVKKPELSIVG